MPVSTPPTGFVAIAMWVPMPEPRPAAGRHSALAKCSRYSLRAAGAATLFYLKLKKSASARNLCDLAKNWPIAKLQRSREKAGSDLFLSGTIGTDIDEHAHWVHRLESVQL
jgi:hypothetical protein